MMTITMIEELKRLEAEAEKVSRYDPGLAGIREDHAAMFACPDGEYVRHADYLAMRNALPELLKALEERQYNAVVSQSFAKRQRKPISGSFDHKNPLPPHGGVDVG